MQLGWNSAESNEKHTLSLPLAQLVNLDPELHKTVVQIGLVTTWYTSKDLRPPEEILYHFASSMQH